MALSVVSNVALAQSDAAKVAPSDLMAFDLPAQSLASALEAFGAVAGQQVVYEGSLAIGRQSVAVKGTFTPEVALRILLTGTGLLPRYMAADGFVLVSDGTTSASQSGDVDTAPRSAVTAYYGRIQAGLRNSFCADGIARAGGYRVAVGLWVDRSGAVTRSALLDSTGDANLDARLDRAVRNVSIGAAPPADFAQPVVLVITPDVMQDCVASKNSMRSTKAGQ